MGDLGETEKRQVFWRLLHQHLVAGVGRDAPRMAGAQRIIAVDLSDGRFFEDDELKYMLAASHPYGECVANITELDKKLVLEHEAGEEDKLF